MRPLRLSVVLIALLYGMGGVETGAFDVGAFTPTGAYNVQGGPQEDCLPPSPYIKFWADDPNGRGWPPDASGWANNDPIESGGTKEWVNSGTAGGNLEQTTASKRPLWKSAGIDLNGRASVKFDETDDFLISDLSVSSWAWLSDDTPYSCYVVLGIPTISTTDFIYTTNAGGATPKGAQLQHAPTINFSGANINASPYTSIYTNIYGGGTQDRGHVWGFVYRGFGTAGDDWTQYVDGSEISQGEAGTDPVAGDPNATLHVGSTVDGTQVTSADIGMFVCWQQAHSAATVAAVHSCLESDRYYGAAFPTND